MNNKIEQFNTEFERITSKAAQDAIRENDDLSESGKAKKLAELDDLSRLELVNLGERLRREVVVSAMEADNLQGMGAILKRDYADFDYNRLAYESRAVESALVLAAGNWAKIQEAFSDAQATGSKHLIKAWRDVAPALLPTELKADKFGIEQDHTNELKAALLDALDLAEYETLTDHGRQLANERQSTISNLDQLAAIARGIDNYFTVPGQTPTRHAAQIFDGVNVNGAQMIQTEPDETPEQYIERSNEATAISRAGADEMARKLGVEIDWTKTKQPA